VATLVVLTEQNLIRGKWAVGAARAGGYSWRTERSNVWFGFIRDDGGQEWFFHRSAVEAGGFEQLNEGQRVSFDEEPSQKGPRAGNIRAAS
jgi:cold shock protein